MWEHREANHASRTPQFFPFSKDMALAMLSEQNFYIIEDVDNLKKGLKGAFTELISGFEAKIQDVIKAEWQKVVRCSYSGNISFI